MSTSPSAEKIAEVVTANKEDVDVDTVHAQAVSFFPRHWIKNWPEHADLDSAAILGGDELDEDGRRTVARSDLFALGSEVATPADALNFFVAVYSWGVGTYSRGVSRGLRVLADKDAGKKILGALEYLRETDFDPGAAYSAFNNYEHFKVKHLGPSFFTKLLYFYSHARLTRSTRVPLILDKYVAAALGWRPWGWTTRQYVSYISLVDEARSLVDSDLPGDVVEYVLFRHRQRIA